MILNGLWRNYSYYFWLTGSKHLLTLKDTAKWIFWLSLCCWVESERRKGKRENPFIPPPLHKGSWMEFPMLAGGEWKRWKGRWTLAISEREKTELSRFSKSPSWTFWKPQHRSFLPVYIMSVEQASGRVPWLPS
jgi:hypothetical protein